MQKRPFEENNQNATVCRPFTLPPHSSSIAGGGGGTSCFVALVVPDTPGCHITIGNNKDATAEEVLKMREEYEARIKPCFPFWVQVCNFRLRGNKNEFPTYDCKATNPDDARTLEDFYRRHYKGKPGKYLYPMLEMHVTIDTDERREAIENIIRRQGGVFRVDEAIFETRNDAADQSAIFDEKTWTCLRCSCVNPIGSKTCSGLRGVCTQWRPKAAMALAQPEPRDGDWMCCGELQFKTRLACRRCGARKKHHRVSTVADECDMRTIPLPVERVHFVYRAEDAEDVRSGVETQFRTIKIASRAEAWRCPWCNSVSSLRYVACPICSAIRHTSC